jgi:dihydroorotate dehydrogenase electron transfer subunit
MAIILNNESVSVDVYKMTVDFTGDVLPGQFFMLRAWDKDPLLSRPISIHDYEPGKLTFLYQRVGKGTEILAQLKSQDEITLQGPYGNGFPKIETNLCVVGGGIGIAPLFYLVKDFKKKNPNKQCRVYLGFRENEYCTSDFKAIANDLIIDIGGIITNQLVVKHDEVVVTCGPEIMMEAVSKVVPKENQVFVSMEAHMACGVGACLGCTCETKSGNKKVCKDGPVFLRDEVFYV